MSSYIKLEVITNIIIQNIINNRKTSVADLVDLPTIDLVTCGECEYRKKDKCWNLKGLNKTDGEVKADDFCSYGERIEE